MVEPSPSELGLAIFEYYPEGDVVQWLNCNYGKSTKKSVPEKIIWRFFLQMAQALAFIHGDIPPGHTKPGIMLHRDLKPQNILVTRSGTRYPSFKLCDFGLAAVWTIDSKDEEDVVGTLEWQPPENPKINTKAADIWSLGACVQFLATGEKPILDTPEDRDRCWEEAQKRPGTMALYRNADQYNSARLPRRAIPINLDKREQLRICANGPIYPQYSDELYHWMRRCMQTAREDRPTTTVLLQDMRNVAQEKLKKEAAWEDMDLTS